MKFGFPLSKTSEGPPGASPPVDEDLVKIALGAPAGDTRAFRELVNRHQGMVKANCRYLGSSPDDAEDLAQEVFVKAYFALPSYEGRAKFRTWLHRIKINHCLNFLKSKHNKKTVPIEAEALIGCAELRVQPHTKTDLAHVMRAQKVREVLDSLPEPLRVSLILSDLDGLSYQGVADALGISMSAARMRINRAREKFRERYAGKRTKPAERSPEGARP